VKSATKHVFERRYQVLSFSLSFLFWCLRLLTCYMLLLDSESVEHTTENVGRHRRQGRRRSDNW